MHGHFAGVFTHTEDLQQGSNVCIEVIHRMLCRYAQQGIFFYILPKVVIFILNQHGFSLLLLFPGKEFPPTLYLQLDNTCKENKNRFLFGYCAMLVRLGLFEKVVVGFLPKGHTHEDIDQMFSRFSVYNSCHDLYCISDIHDACRY